MSATALTTNARSRNEWAEIIGADWRRSVESILQTGRDLVAAKEGPNKLPHGEFMAMVETDLPFKQDTAEQLMRVARHPVISNSDNSRNLPSKMSVLIELSQLSEDDFNDAQEKRLITPDLKVKASRSIARAYKKEKGGVVGGAQHMLPSPREAKKIAAATGRLVAADNGRLYTGAPDEEVAEYAGKRDTTFATLRAINTLADLDKDAFEFFEKAERRWFADFRYSAVDDAIEFLTSLKEAMGVVDA